VQCGVAEGDIDRVIVRWSRGDDARRETLASAHASVTFGDLDARALGISKSGIQRTLARYRAAYDGKASRRTSASKRGSVRTAAGHGRSVMRTMSLTRSSNA
jgi:hypothetical protein